MNNYYIQIKSKNLTAEAAAEMIKFIGENHTIMNSSYYHEFDNTEKKFGGNLFMFIRGCSDISDILEKHQISWDDVKIEDEFEHAWTAIFEQYFTNLPITKEYHSILEKNVNEEVIQLDWDGKNWDELEEYFKTCWGSRNFRFEPENGVIIGTNV